MDFLRDVGKHFTVNYMLPEGLGARSRMEAGISFTEFSYMLLQAYDFLELRRRDGVTLQLGGSDQWGNITAGIELIRRARRRRGARVTMPLVTTSAGTKFGKTEAGAVWLDATRTSPYAFYQFWLERRRSRRRALPALLHAAPSRGDRDARRSATDPGRRAAQRALAADVTRRVHGEKAFARRGGSVGIVVRRRRSEVVVARRVGCAELEIPVFTTERKDELTTYDILEATLSGQTRFFRARPTCGACSNRAASI